MNEHIKYFTMAYDEDAGKLFFDIAKKYIIYNCIIKTV
jgi:hypothetical protein